LNAVDAMTNTGGILTILTTQDSDYLNIVIKDTGIGIPLENQKNIIEPFFSTKPKIEGTGLGLPISYSIVQNHGGTITFTSTEGQGSAFHVRLPTNKQKANYTPNIP
jgi:two-component system NtrC family sensor kinase